MKTNQLILATAALVALAACTKETANMVVPETEANEIGFKAVATMTTKANNAIITGTAYDTDNTFQLWAWQSEAADYSEFSDNAASNFMSNLTIAYCGGPSSRANAWRNNDHYYYWPFTGKIAFLAIHPSTVVPTSTGWDANYRKPKASITGYTISDSNKTVDLMFANNEGTRVSNGNTPVNMVFKHALSQIVFKAKTQDDYSADVQFDLESVQINNIDLSGDVAYANTAFAWTANTTQDQNWMYFNTVKTNIKNTYANADDYIYGSAILMIPQPANIKASELDPSDPNYDANDDVQTTLTIGYSMQQLPKNSNAKITGTVTVAAPQVWEPGNKYVYTLNFNLNEILFNPTVTDWVTVDVATINIP